MPQLKVKLGKHNLIIKYVEGLDGFIEIQDADADTSLHIRDEEGSLLALHFVEGEEDPTAQLELLTGDIYLD